MKLQVTQKAIMAVPDGRGGWFNPDVDASPSPVTLYRYRTLDDAEFKSIVNFEDSNQSPETLPYQKNAPEAQEQVNGIPKRGKEFWWPRHDDDDDEDDEDGDSTMKARKTQAKSQKPVKEDPTRHEKNVQRKERQLLRMELEQKEREVAYRQEHHSMQMAVLKAERMAHEAKRSYYMAKLKLVTTGGHESLRRNTLP